MLKLFSRKAQGSGRVGLSVSEDQVLLAQVSRPASAPGDRPLLEKCGSQVLESGAQPREVLTALVDSMELSGLNCNFVLSPKDYNLYLIEAPAVEAAELRSAVRWKIKDLLDMPVEDAVIDIFPVPEGAFQGRSKMLYAVAAQKSRIEFVIDLVNRSGLNLGAIDVPEMALLNVSSEFLEDRNGLAFMDLRRAGGTMNLSRGGQLYLTRKINTSLGDEVMNSMDWEMQRDRLVLEIQRSLDYYESQMGMDPISQIMLAPRATDSAQMVASLSEVMSVQVGVLDFANAMDMAEGLDAAKQHMYTVVIGAAMRQNKAGS